MNGCGLVVRYHSYVVVARYSWAVPNSSTLREALDASALSLLHDHLENGQCTLIRWSGSKALSSVPWHRYPREADSKHRPLTVHHGSPTRSASRLCRTRFHHRPPTPACTRLTLDLQSFDETHSTHCLHGISASNGWTRRF